MTPKVYYPSVMGFSPHLPAFVQGYTEVSFSLRSHDGSFEVRRCLPMGRILLLNRAGVETTDER